MKVAIKKKDNMLHVKCYDVVCWTAISGEDIKFIDKPMVVTPDRLILLDTNNFISWEYNLAKVEIMIHNGALRKMPEIDYITLYPRSK